MEAAKDFFNGVTLSKFFSSFIILILRVKEPNGFDKLRPISLCSIAYNFFFKIIVGRLTQCLNRIISQERGAFLPDRSIFENITLAQKKVYSINKKSKGGNTVLKANMAKAYDWDDSQFLILVMEGFDFLNKVNKLILEFVKTT